MDAATHTLSPRLLGLESVFCLECGEIYAKPLAGGTVTKNPGCPQCGYVGWIPLSLPPEPHRSGVDPRPHRSFRRS